jgi:DNA-binding GntR family transcriptional regulator
VAPRTRAEELRRQLADDIITGRLAPGTRLDEQELAERFGVSRTPVREALKHLAAIGLADAGPNRGMYAAAISPEKRTELFEVMAEMEGVCARLSAQRMTIAERRQLEALHLRAGEVMRGGDQTLYSDLNFRFHAAIYSGCHNRTIEDMALNARARLAPFRHGQFNLLGRLAKSFTEHDKVVTAILRGDGAGAQAAMLDHVGIVRDASTEYVSRGAQAGAGTGMLAR